MKVSAMTQHANVYRLVATALSAITFSLGAAALLSACSGKSSASNTSATTTSASTPSGKPADSSAATAGGSLRPALTITTERPQTSALGRRIAANGNIAAWQEASVGTEINGLRLTEVRVNVGDPVRKGDVLAVFSADTVQADLAQIRAALAEAEANAAEAAANAERTRTLQASGALSAQQIAQYLTAERTAQARVEAQRAALRVQELRLSQTRVLAPDTGVISARMATVGAVVPAGTELFRMIRQGRLEWRAEVTANEIARITPGTPVAVLAAGGLTVRGKVRMVAPTVDVQSRAALVYVDLPATAGVQGVKAGMFAQGEFELGRSEAVTVSQQALVVRDGYSYVFQLGPDQRVRQLKVETGRREGRRVEITAGMSANGVLAASGAGFLNDGDLVKVVDAPPL